MLLEFLKMIIHIFVNLVGIYLPCYDIFRDCLERFSSKNAPQFTPYVPLVAEIIAQSFACITFSPIELSRTQMQVSFDAFPFK